MSSTPLRQCLFCNHLNPGGASFCNECGSPLHLQPCARCGAIDKRTAKACHKCGEEFSLSASLELASAYAANEIRAESEKSGSLCAITPTILEDQRALSKINDVDITNENTPLPEPAALTISEFGQGFRPESKESSGKDVEAVVLKAELRNDDPEHISDRFMRSVETVSTGRATTWTASRLWWGVAVSVAFLAAMAGSVYYYHFRGQSTQLAENQDVNQLAPPLTSAASIARPLPASDAEMKPLQEPPLIKECPEAITALGLCSPGTKQEK